MRFVGIDIASRPHLVAVESEHAEVLTKPTVFSEDASGDRTLRELLGAPQGTLVWRSRPRGTTGRISLPFWPPRDLRSRGLTHR